MQTDIEEQSGVIEEAEWKESKVSHNPFIQIKIKLDKPLKLLPVDFVFKYVNPLIPFTPWSSSPMENLEEATNTRIPIEGDEERGYTIHLGPILGLLGKRVKFKVTKENFNNQEYARVGYLEPNEK